MNRDLVLNKKTTGIKSTQNFILIIIGQVISVFGSNLLRFALSLYILDITGRADIYATLYAASSVPLLLSPLGGALADRFNRRNLMVIYDLSNGSLVLLLAVIMGLGGANVAVIGVFMFVLAVFGSLDTPNVTSSLPFVVKEDKLESANGIVQSVQALSSVIAPVMGGIIYGIFSIQTLVIFSGAAFILTAVLEAFIKIPFQKRDRDGSMVSTIFKDLKQGFAYVVKEVFVFKAMILAALLNLVLTPYFVVGGPIILRVTMNGSDTLYGLGMGLINAATILGALSIGLFAKRITMNKLYKPLLLIAFLVIPMAVAVMPFMLNMGVYPSFALFIACAVPVAMIMTVISIFVIAKVQKRTPNENLGKVMAIITAVAQCAAPIGQLVYGILFERFSASVYLPTIILCFIMVGMAIFAQRIMAKETVN